MSRYVTGWRKVLLHARISLHVAMHYMLHPVHFVHNPLRYVRFLGRALRLLLVFRHNKPVRLGRRVKLHLYLPASCLSWQGLLPGRAFFRSIESRPLRHPPGPVTVVYSMTRACRHHCPHCCQRLDRGKDLDEALLLRTAREIRDAGTPLFDIGGGEPFLHFERLMTLVRALGDGVEIWAKHHGRRPEGRHARATQGGGLLRTDGLYPFHRPVAARRFYRGSGFASPCL